MDRDLDWADVRSVSYDVDLPTTRNVFASIARGQFFEAERKLIDMESAMAQNESQHFLDTVLRPLLEAERLFQSLFIRELFLAVCLLLGRALS